MYRYHEMQATELSTRTQLRNLSNLVFVEITSGLYFIEKDRMGYMGTKSYVDVREVSGALNNREKVTVFGAKGEMSSNTSFNIL